jgi:hypothetical protein
MNGSGYPDTRPPNLSAALRDRAPPTIQSDTEELLLRTRHSAPVRTPRILAMVSDTEPRRCEDGRTATEEGRGGRAQATAAALSITGRDPTAS